MLRWWNRVLTRNRPRLGLSRLLLKPVHGGFGGALKAFFVGGAFTDPAVLRFFYGLGVQVANGYGLTEAGTVVTLNDFDDYRPDTVGRPLEGTEVRITDPGPDGVGEVCVRGPTVMAGYWGNPEATAKALRDGWLWTGDLGSLDADGFLTLRDRSKDLIISGGSNIYPREVEEVLLLHPGVAEASVVGKPDPEWGESVVAFVVARAEPPPVEALDRLCLEHIARFKRPKEYRFVAELPKNNYGKVLKTELRARLASG
jgi:acyl-CoA synthetase (AMP-forming)/AMP-acid ligase II